MYLRGWATFLFVLFCCSCCGFHSTTNDMSQQGGGDDMAMSSSDNDGFQVGPDFAGAPPGSDLSTTAADNCGHPQLLIATENLHDTSTGALGGKVSRFSLGDGSALPAMCTQLSAGALMDAHPLAVAWVPPLSIAVGTPNGFYVLNPMNDTIRWKASETNPMDIFVMQDAMAKQLIALVIGSSGGVSDAGEVHTYDAAGNPVNVWKLDGGIGASSLPLGFSIWSMTVSPLDPTHIFATGGSTVNPAWDVDTINKTKTTYRPANGTTMSTIYSLAASKRTAWATKYQTPSAVYYTNEPNPTTTALSGPIRCTPGCDSILHVVPDPTQSDRFIALCDAATTGGPRQIVRFTTAGGTCEKVVDDTGLGTQLRMARMAIAP